MPAPDTILEARDVSCHFDVSPPWLTRVVERRGRRILKAVDGVSFRVRRGTTFSIVGESGCGKSTLARLVVGLVQPTAGTIAFGTAPDAQGKPRTPRLQMIFQDPYASLNPRWTVEDIVAEPLHELKLRQGAAISARVGELLSLVGLARTDASRYPHEFSGGQRQRISIARALATEADLLVCDEPTSALDVSVQAQVLNLMRGLQAELALTYVFISHNLAVVRHMSDDLAVMYLGRFVETGPAEGVFEGARHPYSRLLLDTIPDIESPNRERAPLTGEVPNPINRPRGCAFAPRCSLATDLCRSERPELGGRGDVAVACHHAA
ncbi:ABC transporter ATP-binding protein [uncultured Alsobacter sp.]|uniref:ABC transporter ATP-binding protein n=1 Tax=uncultured Alsobacter sp. TaxID=1748258 RepID=UPI0025DC1CCE|nr:oligopeptide/dipeptide ABC transporter ATP-binding protein [uncultured Alsobacter sp.]